MHKSARLDHPLQGSAYISPVHKDVIPGLCPHAFIRASSLLCLKSSEPGHLDFKTWAHHKTSNLSRCCAVIDLIHEHWQQQSTSLISLIVDQHQYALPTSCWPRRNPVYTHRPTPSITCLPIKTHSR
ncbi:hypothetical protein A4X13_0g6103 [Tilletia indica]|uniref:Uncharacterized protein n=1 Tax=Tilletia indica TaxID=43049 RepID=A0A177TAR9_9BASI|nr:hypothetical protein A4X13_0g6103 [Tilletia indica]